MSSLYFLGILAVLVAFAAISGVVPDETRTDARSRLLRAARIALGGVALVLAVGLAIRWLG